MPFTPFHLGLALVIGLPFRKHIHAPTFILTNIVLDMEPFLVLILDLYSYSLHGYAHSFLITTNIGAILALIVYTLRKPLKGLFRALKLITYEQNLDSYLIAGVSGTLLHVLLDAPLYIDIRPLYPLNENLFFNPKLAPLILDICVLLLIAGLALYVALLLTNREKQRKIGIVAQLRKLLKNS